ncbi:MAG: PEGA domain-containing protein [Defluviitaleaceae bacterium]|nr:PEGA domain-containing protein [Defluviitaleaceae bacterium]
MSSRDNEEKRRPGESPRRRGSHEREGVYYTPSNRSAPKRGSTNSGARKAPNPVRRPVKEPVQAPPKSKKRASKGQYITFYIVTLVAAVAVCLATFAFVLSSVVNNRPSTGVPGDTLQANSTNTPEQVPVLAIDEISITGVIMELNHGERSLEIFDLGSQRNLDFRADNATSMQNRYGEVMSFAQFRAGDIVDARYTEVGGILSSMNLATAAWERRNVTNLRVNAENRTITLGNETFRYDDRTISIFNNDPYSIENINPLNVVTLRGMGSDVWFVEVSRGTGFINIVNGDDIRDGIIEIDNDMVLQLNDRGTTDEPIRVQSGNRRIRIRGSNIEDFDTSLDVNPGESAILNLSDVQITAGVVTININEADAIVTINGTPVRAAEPQILTYGSYELVIWKEGFRTYESTFELNEPALELNIFLEPEIRTMNITVETIPLGARIYVDNAFVGLSPVTTSVEEGVRMISARMAGFIDVNFPTDGGSRYEVILRELTPPPVQPGFGMPPVMP